MTCPDSKVSSTAVIIDSFSSSPVHSSQVNSYSIPITIGHAEHTPRVAMSPIAVTKVNSGCLLNIEVTHNDPHKSGQISAAFWLSLRLIGAIVADCYVQSN